MNKKVIVANWKLNGNQYQIMSFVKSLNTYSLKNNDYFCKTIIAFPTLYLHLAQSIISSKKIFLSAQNIDINITGAFTGDISVNMLKDIGINYSIIGHSERRIHHEENNVMIAKKFKVAKDANIIPILCIGENNIEKELQQTQSVCQKQLDLILKLCGPLAFHNAIIAYEPIWAIGTGKTASPEVIQEIHSFIRQYIIDYNILNDKKLSIYYGGSVDEKNISSLLNKPDIDGVLVGNASLNYNKFIKIINLVNMI